MIEFRLYIRTIIHLYVQLYANTIANLAQLVEQLIRNEQVAGSIPAVGSSAKIQSINLKGRLRPPERLKNKSQKMGFF
jgi:hypothetical protein